jgi:hypothetical protein
MKMKQSVSKRRYIKFRRREITQKKAYNIQKTAKILNQEENSYKYGDIGKFCINVWQIWRIQNTQFIRISASQYNNNSKTSVRHLEPQEIIIL